jgi:hypothetical protein
MTTTDGGTGLKEIRVTKRPFSDLRRTTHGRTSIFCLTVLRATVLLSGLNRSGKERTVAAFCRGVDASRMNE